MTFDIKEIESALASVERIAALIEKVRPGDTQSLSRGLRAQADGMRGAVAHIRSILGIEVVTGSDLRALDVEEVAS